MGTRGRGGGDICSACCHGANGEPCSVGGSLTWTTQRGCPLAGHRANRTCQPVAPAPLTVPSRVLWEATVPIQRLRRASCRVPSPSRPPHWRGPKAPERSNLRRCREKGTRGTRRRGGVLPNPTLSPCRGGQRPGSPAVPRCLLPWCAGAASAGRALAPCPVAVSSRFLLFIFLSFYSPPPPNTSPRNARGGGSTISHCEHLSLYCSARQNTARPG